MKCEIKETDHPFMKAVQIHITTQLQLTAQAHLRMVFNDLNFEGYTSDSVRKMGEAVRGSVEAMAVNRALFFWWCGEHDLDIPLVNDVASTMAVRCHLGNDDKDELERMARVLLNNHMGCHEEFQEDDEYAERVLCHIPHEERRDIAAKKGFKPRFSVTTAFLGVTPAMISLEDDGTVAIDWEKLGSGIKV